MRKITISDELACQVSELQLSCILCDVIPVPVNVQLWNEIQQKISEIASTISIEQICRLPAISSSRKAYKTCGKDPARYRLSAEALLRRVVNRKEIYQINNVVDLLNLVSITTGFSIGGYDAGKIIGDVVFGIGQTGEEYFGIGRGQLNIDGMPVFRDSVGAFGTPTSDSDRTSVSLETRRFLMIIIDYASSSQLSEATIMAKNLLEKYAEATNFEIKTIANYP